MADREKVVKGLQCCTSYEKCDECPYEEYKDPYAVICMDKMHTDALNVLKEREETHKILVEKADEMYAMLKEHGKSSCDGCECKGSEDCPLDHVSDGNVVCPNGRLNTDDKVII